MGVGVFVASASILRIWSSSGSGGNTRPSRRQGSGCRVSSPPALCLQSTVSAGSFPYSDLCSSTPHCTAFWHSGPLWGRQAGWWADRLFAVLFCCLEYVDVCHFPFRFWKQMNWWLLSCHWFPFEIPSKRHACVWYLVLPACCQRDFCYLFVMS